MGLLGNLLNIHFELLCLQSLQHIVQCSVICVKKLSVNCSMLNWLRHRLSIKLDLQSLFGLHVYSCTHETLQPPPPRIWAHIRWRYWSTKIEDISL
jgi:hypothetical protein